MTIQLPKTFIDRSPEACLFVSLDGTIEYTNNSTDLLFGFEKGQLLGRSIQSLIADRQQQQFNDYFKRTEANDDLLFFESQGANSSGAPLELSISVTPIFGPNLTCISKLVMIRDLSRQKEALRELQEREFKLSAIIQCSPSALSLKTPNGIYALANPNLQKIHGLTEQQIIGKSDFDLYPEKVAKTLRENDQLIIKGKCKHSIEEFIPINGELHCFMSHMFPIFDGQGEIQYICRISLDITSQRSTEEQIKILVQAIEQSPISMMITDSNKNIEFVNQQFLKTTGYDSTEVIGKRPTLLASGKTCPEVYLDLQCALNENRVWHGEFINRRKNGDEYCDSATISTIRQPSGQVSHYVAVQEDITDFKLIQNRLTKSEERFNLAMQGSSDGLWDWDIVTDELYWSPRWKAMLGYKASELVAKFDTWEILIHPDDRYTATEMLKQAMDDRQKTQFSGQFRLAHKNGHWVTVISRGLILRDAQGHPVRMVGTHIDQTEMESLQAELKKAWYLAQAQASTSDTKANELEALNQTIKFSLEDLEKEIRLLDMHGEDHQLQSETILRLKEVVQTLANSLNNLNEFAELGINR